RFDGNTAFGRSLGLQAYPKVSGSYVISDEPFWPARLGELKLRGALGWSGRAPGAFDAVRSWRAVTSSGQSGYEPGSVGDTLIGPERTREAELGLDAALLGNRLTIAATWYHRLTTDALYSVRQISSLGFPQSQTANVGSMSNKGIELSARGEYQGGAWIQDGASFNALSRSVRWPTCSRAYAVAYTGANGALDPTKVSLLTARERKECLPLNTNLDTFWFPQDFW